MITRLSDRYLFQTHNFEPERSNRRDAVATFGFLIPVGTSVSWPAFSELIRLHYGDAKALAMASLVEKF